MLDGQNTNDRNKLLLADKNTSASSEIKKRGIIFFLLGL